MVSSTVGHFAPLGATYLGGGWWNFAVYSPKRVVRLALGEYETGLPSDLVVLDPSLHRTGDIWHVRVQVKKDRFVWGWEVEPSGKVFASSRARYALDPYAPLLKTGNSWGANAWEELSLGSDRLFCVATTSTPFSWKEPSHSPLRPDSLLIYETHVRGWTKDPSSHVTHPGTYLGMIEKIPHLKAIGITAIELLPIYEFDESEWKLTNPLTGERLFNYWGYSPLSFFSPMQRYGTTSDPIETARELKCFVEACHDEGIAVIVDVVYNHTGEGNERGPAYSLKLLDEETYYITNEDGSLANYSGCGNTLNANHPVAWNLVLDSLRHWVCEYRIDGFRFDLASALTRSQTGAPMEDPPLIETIIKDPIIGRCILIAEPWDAAGLYQTGHLFNLNQCHYSAFSEWNDRFRDDVRRFIKGDEGMSGAFASRLCGSEDVFGPDGTPLQSINYIAAHDGFSLYDLVSYQSKHNLPNGEQNRDGMNENFSWNCGVEGPTDKQHILHLRDRQIKNFLVALFLSQGIPMILLGDECHRTKAGNNNTWCQDASSWLNWDQIRSHSDLSAMISSLIKIRNESGCFRTDRFLTPEDIEWHGAELQTPSWLPENHLVACTLNDSTLNPRLFLAFNASPLAQEVEIPKYPSGSWHIAINTARPHDTESCPRLTRHVFELAPYSSIVLCRPQIA